MCLKFEDTTQNFSLCRDNADQPWSTTGFKHFIFWQTQIADQQINKSIIYIFYYHEENVKKHYPNKQIKIEHYCTLMYIIMCCIMWHIVVYFYGYLQFIIFNSSSFFWTLSSLNTTHFECQWPTKKNAIENPPVDPLFFSFTIQWPPGAPGAPGAPGGPGGPPREPPTPTSYPGCLGRRSPEDLLIIFVLKSPIG